MRKLDYYQKSIDGIQVKTYYGGIITIVSSVIILVLFISELNLFVSTHTKHRMHVDHNVHHLKLPISVDLTMKHASCNEVEMIVGENHYPSAVHGVSVRKIPNPEGACRFVGTIMVSKVAGELIFKHTGSPDLFNLLDFLQFNSSHSIEHLKFGKDIPNRVTPLVHVDKVIHETVATYTYFIKVVPTRYKYLYGTTVDSYQYSVTEHAKSPQPNGPMIFPSVVFAYEFSPIMVEYTVTKKSIFQFLTSACAILGGVFAVAGLADRLVYTASNKVD